VFDRHSEDGVASPSHFADFLEGMALPEVWLRETVTHPARGTGCHPLEDALSENPGVSRRLRWKANRRATPVGKLADHLLADAGVRSCGLETELRKPPTGASRG